MHCFIEKTPQLPKDPLTITWHPQAQVFHILPVEEPSPNSIRSLGSLTGSTSPNTQGWPNKVSSSNSSSSNHSSVLPTQVEATMLPSSLDPYRLIDLFSHPLWMDQSLEGWRR